MFASAMLAADPVTSGVYYVDDHFVPYAGAKPVAQGLEQQARPGGEGPRGHPRHRARRAGGVLRDRRAVRADRHAAEGAGRAEEGRPARRDDHARLRPRRRLPAGLRALPRAAACTGSPTGGRRWPSRRCCRSSPRSPYAGRTRQIAWAEETVQLKDYGEARQITLFEHGRVALQILTSDFDACPAEILSWLKSRWREENFLKYASENYGIDKICDYLASIETNTKLIAQPGPQDQANAAVRDAEKTLAAAERDLAVLLADPAITPAAKNARDPAPRRRRSPAPAPRLAAAVTARDPIPAKLPASAHRPRREDRAAARRAARPADGPAAARPQRRALAIGPPQRLPARRRRVPRHHPPDHHPRPGRHHHLHPRRDHRHPRPARLRPASPAPWPCSSTRSTPPRPPCPATAAPSPTTSHPRPGI